MIGVRALTDRTVTGAAPARGFALPTTGANQERRAAMKFAGPTDAGSGRRDDLVQLLSSFHDQADADRFGAIVPGEIPAAFGRLLVHDHHMTVTLEAHFATELSGPHRHVAVHVHQSRTEGDLYLRKVTLTAHPERPPVLAGLVQLDLRVCPEEMRREIVEGRTPLGHLLIRHHPMRSIEPGPYWRIDASRGVLGMRFECPPVVYGRLATIHCDRVRALRLLEVITRV